MNTPKYSTIYVPGIAAARSAVIADPQVRLLITEDTPVETIELFLLFYSSLAVQITRPVAEWIERAGIRCKATGLEEIGDMLIKHSAHEDGHHRMLIEDARFLVNHWNAKHSGHLSLGELLAMAPTPSMIAYRALHEIVIESERPHGQVAIELEIERLSLVVGSELVRLVKQRLPELAAGLHFLQEHVEIDAGHTALNERIMERVLTARPDDGEWLVTTGTRALEAYAGFIRECFDAANALQTPDYPAQDVSSSARLRPQAHL